MGKIKDYMIDHPDEPSADYPLGGSLEPYDIWRDNKLTEEGDNFLNEPRYSINDLNRIRACEQKTLAFVDEMIKDAFKTKE